VVDNQFNEMTFEVQMVKKIGADFVRGLLCCAFEGGSNYWYDDVAPEKYPDGKTRSDYNKGGSAQPDGDYWHWCQLLPTTGGSVSLVDKEDGKRYVLDAPSIERGLAVMAEKYPSHWADALEGNDDAWTGDCFLQCCVFGETVYG